MNQNSSAQRTTVSRPQTGQYKGHPMIILNPDDRFPFQFGLHKASLILQHINDIREFVEETESAATPMAAALSCQCTTQIADSNAIPAGPP